MAGPHHLHRARGKSICLKATEEEKNQDLSCENMCKGEFKTEVRIVQEGKNEASETNPALRGDF